MRGDSVSVAATILNATFTSGAEGFTYADNAFRGANQPNFASGALSNGKLEVTVGGGTFTNTSGGWSKSFTTTAAGPVSVSFKYSMTSDLGIDPGEWQEALVSIDGKLYGAPGVDYVRRIEGGGNQAEVTFSFTSVSLSAGNHTIKLGAAMNKASHVSEIGSVTIDDVSITANTTCEPVCLDKQCGSDGCGGECGTCGAGFTCGIDPGFTEYPTCFATDVWVEAECRATAIGGYSSVQTATTGFSGTGYLLSLGNTTAPTGDLSTDKATYKVKALVPGAHKIWFRVNNNNTTQDDSWFYRVGSGAWTNMNNMNAVGWTWYKGTTDITLAVGNNTIEIANRENGLKIDKIYVTSSTLTPSGLGSQAPCNLCGDAVVQAGEECDHGVNDGSYGGCTPSCTLGPRCGDALLQPGEECDHGVNDGSYGGCTPSCTLGPRCGDAVVQAGEECDHGVNDGSYGGCTSSCTLGPRCGDALLQPGEECDDGNAVNLDGCSVSCLLE
jgi:cysteine-rich repeat protein